MKYKKILHENRLGKDLRNSGKHDIQGQRN